ncbi:saccharopine dehydrogenase [Halovenus sp. WSH3]|uniref:Saccharopine dehydrogenase n=1 Tax=Halovenus carboxidivorans TaxID=2692199 RepID=A0A6B0T6V4_9EURY|nr:saccharopine dehydrogenase NADP-binding domain-containing protein [Halovenus carboxidivorans]MXR51303.1 saccharopine dehydrogenase [Halovenus carboxidivorans]
MTTLVYGAYGYTGELIVEEARDRGLDIVVAGRNGTKTRGLATMVGADARVFDTDDAADHLDGVDALLNCAGPFARTYEPLVEACLDTETHYLDITGEFEVFEALAERDREAEKAGICLLPGAGFDVVPTDCLAGHLHERLPDATELRLGFDALSAVSGGTVASALEHASGGGKVRRDGRIVDVPVASAERTIDFGRGPRHAVTIPWGDVSTAYYTTGIENIEVYTPMPEGVARLLRVTAPAMGVLGVGPIKRGLQALARGLFDGPTEQQRGSDRAYVWGEATNGEETVVSRLETPEPYTLTVDAATTALSRFEDGTAPPGYHTPASAFDPNFVLELDDIEGFVDE